MSYTMEFILTSAFISFTVGAFMSLVIVQMILENSKSIIKWTVWIILMLTIGCGLGALITLENKGDDKTWNNGYCIECNGNYKFVSVVHYKNSGDEYYYDCDKCGHIIVLNSLKEK